MSVDALDLKALGDALVRLRTQRGMSRRDLAEAAGLSYPYMAELEKGRKNPSSRALGGLAAALDIEPLALQSVAEGRTSLDELVWPAGGPLHASMPNAMQFMAQATLPAGEADSQGVARAPGGAEESELVEKITAAVIRELGPMIHETVARAVREAGNG